MEKECSSGRRNFLKTAAVGTAAMALQPGVGKVFASSGSSSPSPLNKWPGRVAINFNKAAVSGGSADTAVNKKMVDQAIQLLTGKEDIGEAWKSIFPDTLSATSKIAIKVVCYNPYKSGLHWTCAAAICEGLQKMEIGGTKFPAGNITVYEMTTSQISNAVSVAGYTAANFPGVVITSAKDKVDGGDGALNNRQYAKALKNADFLINCFNARGHVLPDSKSKFTLGFKSHFGTYDNPNGMHSNISSNIRELACTGPVFQKHVLSVCAAIFGLNEGSGPGAETGNDNKPPEDFNTYVKKMDSSATSLKDPSTVIVSTDPVAAEMQAIKILRINKGGKYAPSDLPPYVQASAGIDQSGFTPTYNIGICDESKMEILKMVNDVAITTSVSPSLPAKRNALAGGMSAHQITGSGGVFIDFKLPESYVDKDAVVEIYNARGSLVHRLSHRVLGIDNHLSWDERDARRACVAKGMYVAKLSCGSVRNSTQFLLF